MVNFNLRRYAGHLLSLSPKNTFLYPSTLNQEKRNFWGWLNMVFNKYDESRVLEVGPDRACAEWLIRCGCGVKWSKGATDWFRDYNALPATYDRSLKIIEVDATDSAVMNIGFKHFRGVPCRKMIFHKAGYFDDSCIIELNKYLKETLKELQISSCGNVSSAGITLLGDFKNLEKLLLYDFPLVNNREECINILIQALPRCKVDFPYAQASERKAQNAENK